jgi:hypothetical protein
MVVKFVCTILTNLDWNVLQSTFPPFVKFLSIFIITAVAAYIFFTTETK